MRVPDESPRRLPLRRRSIVAVSIIVGVVVLLIVVQGLAGFYTNFLWFHYQGVGEVWRTKTLTELVLALVFIVISFAAIWGCLVTVDKVAPRAMFMAPDSELVRRFQTVVGPHARLLRIAVAFVIALALGTSTSSQWQHWILFEHPVSFGETDPQFHRDLSFFVYRLPFLSFLVDWVLALLLVALIVSVVAYFLNGSVRLQASPHVEPRALAHLSLIVCAMALVRAWAYYYIDRFTLDLSSNGLVNGATYTDVHVRLPAMKLLAVISLAAFVLLAINVYRRTLVLPAIAVGLWALLALVIGVIYPALVQAFRVTPAQSTLELPYIARNITATQAASGIAHVKQQGFAANRDLTPGVLDLYSSTLDDAVLWDPTIAGPTFQNLQKIRSFYQLTSLVVDRYDIDGSLEPVVVGVRALATSGIQRPTWVNTHLQYTHGYGVVVASAATATANGTPQFLASNLPPSASASKLALRQPRVYFAPGQETYTVVNTRQPEFDYPNGANGGTIESHYAGSGGIPTGSILNRLALSLHLRDFNLLVSSDVTAKSRLIYIPDVRALVQKAVPFLKVDTHPYAVIVNGEIDWVVDAYTTSAYYPYAETEPTSVLPAGSGLAGTYNYVRDAVKVVVNAYSGKMSLYTIDPKSDPLIRSYSAAFPGLFQPMSQMPTTLRNHLRYPQDLLELQAATYGRYHVPASEPGNFYSLSDAWDLSQISTSTSGSPSAALALGTAGQVQRFTPIYELLQLPGRSSQSFEALEPLVPYSPMDKIKTLSALMTADSDPGSYGKLAAFVTPRGQSIDGPALAAADIKSNRSVSQEITLLNNGTGGSKVSFGTVQILPIADSLLYVLPLYVSSSQTNYPELSYVVVVYGKHVELGTTLAGALDAVFGASIPGGQGSGPTTISSRVEGLVSEASSDYASAQQALGRDDLGTYQKDVEAAGAAIDEAKALIAPTKKTKRSASSAHPSTTVPQHETAAFSAGRSPNA